MITVDTCTVCTSLLLPVRSQDSDKLSLSLTTAASIWAEVDSLNKVTPENIIYIKKYWVQNYDDDVLFISSFLHQIYCTSGTFPGFHSQKEK